ncbi:hypothetical protein JAAARDRAFT_63134 [Jaapia argillacea MUCL 33604]|uniref:RING-type domain-containing protein n=1 Tax=Jaapia argillacea MUCL 33604 TaxID=933084 RepID=A0A067PJ91_9AGAM|nr:hypothetical protein JAAARDRAFT_63134 [Jaapia argillacea MUCL 33604]
MDSDLSDDEVSSYNSSDDEGSMPTLRSVSDSSEEGSDFDADSISSGGLSDDMDGLNPPDDTSDTSSADSLPPLGPVSETDESEFLGESEWGEDDDEDADADIVEMQRAFRSGLPQAVSPSLLSEHINRLLHDPSFRLPDEVADLFDSFPSQLPLDSYAQTDPYMFDDAYFPSMDVPGILRPSSTMGEQLRSDLRWHTLIHAITNSYQRNSAKEAMEFISEDLVLRYERLRGSGGEAEKDGELTSTCPICHDDLLAQDDISVDEARVLKYSKALPFHEPPDTAIVASPCRHVFHLGCITPWFDRKPNCPSCRSHVRRSSNAITFAGWLEEEEIRVGLRERPRLDSPPPTIPSHYEGLDALD